jgi:hypothetical protein
MSDIHPDCTCYTQEAYNGPYYVCIEGCEKCPICSKPGLFELLIESLKR